MSFQGGTPEETVMELNVHPPCCVDKHPNDKAVRRNLSQQVTKCETELANLQSDYNSKLSAYKTVEDSFARKIEADIVASNPDRYIVNGVKKLGASQ